MQLLDMPKKKDTPEQPEKQPRKAGKTTTTVRVSEEIAHLLRLVGAFTGESAEELMVRGGFLTWLLAEEGRFIEHRAAQIRRGQGGPRKPTS